MGTMSEAQLLHFFSSMRRNPVIDNAAKCLDSSACLVSHRALLQITRHALSCAQPDHFQQRSLHRCQSQPTMHRKSAENPLHSASKKNSIIATNTATKRATNRLPNRPACQHIAHYIDQHALQGQLSGMRRYCNQQITLIVMVNQVIAQYQAEPTTPKESAQKSVKRHENEYSNTQRNQKHLIQARFTLPTSIPYARSFP